MFNAGGTVMVVLVCRPMSELVCAIVLLLGDLTVFWASVADGVSLGVSSLTSRDIGCCCVDSMPKETERASLGLYYYVWRLFSAQSSAVTTVKTSPQISGRNIKHD